jgi:hypothetical protein
MFSDELLNELQHLVRLVPGLATVRIRYTRSALLLTTNLPNEDGNVMGSLFLFFILAFCLFGMHVAALHKAWGIVAACALLAGALGYGLRRVSRRVDASAHWPPNFIVDAATRRITLPAPGSWWAPAAAPRCRFEEVADIQARLVWADTGYGERAELRLRLSGRHPQEVLTLSSYAVAQQLAAVLRQIVFAPADSRPA